MARPFTFSVRRSVLIVMSLFFFATCGVFDPSSYDDLIITTDRKVYFSDDSLKVSIINKTGELLHYNLCLNNFQFLKENEWTIIIEENRAPCPLYLATLSPGKTAALMISLHEIRPLKLGSLEPGLYRIVFNSIMDKKEKGLPEKHRISNTFEIVSK